MSKILRPTPAKWRKFGDILLVLSLSADAFAINYGHEIIGYIAVVSGMLGKVIIAALTATPENIQKDNGLDPN